MLKNFVALVSACLTLQFAVWNLQGQTSPKTPPPDYKIPPEAANRSNPVKPSPESLARGKKIYGYDCAVCHGKDGDGKGDMTDMKVHKRFPQYRISDPRLPKFLLPFLHPGKFPPANCLFLTSQGKPDCLRS